MSKRSKLPVVSGREVIRALHKVGFNPARQKGDHVFLKHPDGRRTTVPLHAEINKSTLMDIIEQVGLTKEEFTDLL
ncbi:MAG: type II toxin-antitoxin system HicA family toxin [Nitrososphaerota archaeon]|nr:type II toxin-antitoxin system HicA family toxin [Nitrososphaerota archaeon]